MNVFIRKDLDIIRHDSGTWQEIWRVRTYSVGIRERGKSMSRVWAAFFFLMQHLGFWRGRGAKAVGWETETATAAEWEVRTEHSPDGVSMLSDKTAAGAEMGTVSLKLYCAVMMDHCILPNSMLVWRTNGKGGTCLFAGYTMDADIITFTKVGYSRRNGRWKAWIYATALVQLLRLHT